MTMELDDCITKDCSTIYRFQFASIAFICGVYLPFTFHSNIWSLYTQSFRPINCTTINNLTTRSYSVISIKNLNESECCACNGTINDRRLLALCQEWMGNLHGLVVRKATIIDEWYLACGKENHKRLFFGSISFLIAEMIGVVTIGILADHYGRKLMLLMCLYIPVLFGSLAAFTTTYSLFLILRWPVGFLNKSLLSLGFIMVIESCEYKHRAQIGCLLLASLPIFGIIIGVTYFFLLDWRYMQLLGTLIATLTLCYPWLIPESRRWYVNSHRASRVNKLLQICSTRQASSIGLNKIGSLAPTNIIYDKPDKSSRMQTDTIFCLLRDKQLRTITCCLFLLWGLSSFCYRCTLFPSILSHSTINYVLMNAIEFFSFIIALIVAYKLGRRPPLAVLTLISGLSSVSLAIILLGTGHMWLEIIFSLLARSCLRICFCLLILFTSELYPTSIRATGLAIGLASETLAKVLAELLFYFFIERTLLLFISGGILCLSCCLIIPLPETMLYDLPDSIPDLQSMKRSISNDSRDDISQHNTMTREPRSNAAVNSNLNDLSSPTLRTILRSQQSIRNKTVTIDSQPEIIQLRSPSSSNGTIEQYADNRVVISIRGGQSNTNEDYQTKF